MRSEANLIKRLSYFHDAFTETKVDGLLADDIDADSDFGAHQDHHRDLEPSMPPSYPTAAAALEASPPGPVPPLPSAGQHLQTCKYEFTVRRNHMLRPGQRKRKNSTKSDKSKKKAKPGQNVTFISYPVCQLICAIFCYLCI